MEIERKFLVSGDFMSFAKEKRYIKQGYLVNNDSIQVRVRIKGNHGYLTVKSNNKELSRYENEIVIPYDMAGIILDDCPTLIEKIRYIAEYKGHTFEIDEFLGDNKGLVIAEVELSSEDEEVELPPFLGEEVTGDERYYNSYILMHPFNKDFYAER